MIEKEKDLEKKLTKEVNQIGWAIKLESNWFTGLPDRMCLFKNGKIIFAEVKETNKKPTKMQSFVHRRLSLLGFDVRIIDSSEKIQKLIRDAQTK